MKIDFVLRSGVRAFPPIRQSTSNGWGTVLSWFPSRIRDVEHLTVRLVEEWRLFDQNIVDTAVKQWRLRLKTCVVKFAGGHFEARASTLIGSVHAVNL